MHVSLLLALLTAFGALAPAAPQEPAASKDHDAIHREMEQLFQQVELRQRAIDRQLYGASAGEKLVKPVAESGILSLIQKSRDDTQQVQRDMQRILELAASHTHKGGGT